MVTTHQTIVGAIVVICGIYIYFNLPSGFLMSSGQDPEDRKTQLLLENFGITAHTFQIDSAKREREIKKAATRFAEEISATNPGKVDSSGLQLYFFSKVREFEDILTAKKTGIPRNRDALKAEHPPTELLNPGKVGDRVQVELVDGKTHTRITRSIQPPVFEIPDFLSPEECDAIIATAEKTGLEKSTLFSASNEDVNEDKEKVTRISQQTWLNTGLLGAHFTNILRSRLSKLTGLSSDVIDGAEPVQAVYYEPGGHYHSHLDSNEDYQRPCCFQTECADDPDKQAECCRICRLATVLYYLNDVEEGGETAFPLADISDEDLHEQLANITAKKHTWKNLSYNCHTASLVVKPKRGTAIMWYNHYLDDKGYLGLVDHRSFHGGCDIIKGHKWVANTWIGVPLYETRFITSKHHWKRVIKLVEE